MQTIKRKKAELFQDVHPDDIVGTLLARRHMVKGFVMDDITHDPLLLPDIKQALEKMRSARDNHERVMIFGDYDVDGISSTAALFLFLRDDLGMDVSYRLPHRVHDGYGIKSYHMEEIAKTGTKLVITVDCGTKDREPIEFAQTLGMDVIVTDHHSCPEILPTCIAVINPRRSDSRYPFGGLSGSGVVWKCIHAMADFFFPEKTEYILQKYVDIVSLGTVADCMPMLDENRTIVRRGILQSQQSHHAFFQTFVDKLDHPIRTEEDIGFFVGPILNAGGRISTPYQSLSALLSNALDSFAHIQGLITTNQIRKEKSRTAFEKALNTIDVSAPLLVYIDEKLEHGILGLVAARLTEIYHKPSAVFTLHEGNYVGSLRAPLGFDLVRVLDRSASFLTRYGGHAGAAGCTIDAGNITLALHALQENTSVLSPDGYVMPVLQIDSVLDPERVTLETLSLIDSLRPFGPGFPAPVFLLRNINSPVSFLGKTEEHIRWDTPDDLEILGFCMGEFHSLLQGHPNHLIGTLKSHTWRQNTTLQFHVVDAILSE